MSGSPPTRQFTSRWAGVGSDWVMEFGRDNFCKDHNRNLYPNFILALSLQVKACIQNKNSIKDIKHATESYVGISDAKILTGL